VTTWENLPDDVQRAVSRNTGPVAGARPVPGGNHSDLTTVLDTPAGPVFLKGARTEPERQDIRTLRREAAIGPHVTQHAPRLLWSAEAGGWLLLGFEYVEGRRASYAPGSPDLHLLADVIRLLQATSAPPVPLPPIERRWKTLTEDASPMAGHSLLHCDLNPGNVLITPDGRAVVVDWALTSIGAPWVELGLLIPWLLRDGMAPAQAAEWLEQFPSWASAPDHHIGLFSRCLAEQWRIQEKRNPQAWVVELADLTSRWEQYLEHRNR